MNLELLKSAINNYVNLNTPHLKDQSVKNLMAESLANFVVDATNKFDQGQVEHGGDIRDRDLQFELRFETIDAFWYNEASKWPPKK